jgi:hypothetical protein
VFYKRKANLYLGGSRFCVGVWAQLLPLMGPPGSEWCVCVLCWPWLGFLTCWRTWPGQWAMHLWSMCFSFLFIFGGIGDWTRGCVLARQVLYHLIHALSPFTFQKGSLAFVPEGLGWLSSHLYLPSSCDYRHVPPHLVSPCAFWYSSRLAQAVHRADTGHSKERM